MTKKMVIEVLEFIRAEYDRMQWPLHRQALDTAISAVKGQKQAQRLHGYSDLKVGDRVIMTGTVIEVSESGVEIIVPDMDGEGYVITRKMEGRNDQEMLLHDMQPLR